MPGEVVLACDARWEGRHCGYFTPFPDGLRRERIGDEPVTGKGAYDSQNVAFWDGERREDSSGGCSS